MSVVAPLVMLSGGYARGRSTGSSTKCLNGCSEEYHRLGVPHKNAVILHLHYNNREKLEKRSDNRSSEMLL